MCGGHADEPVAGFAEGDVVRLDYEEKNVRGRVGRVGKTNPEWGLRIDWPDETLEPVWVSSPRPNDAASMAWRSTR